MSCEFQGYAWNELATCWNVPVEEGVNYEETVKKYLWDSMGGDYKFKNPKMREDLVSFLLKLAEEEEKIGYRAPVFRGMAAIESDWTLVDWVTKNFEQLWT